MIKYVRTTPNHLVYIHEQVEQKGDVSYMLRPSSLSTFERSMALTAFDGPVCLGCGGLIEYIDEIMLWAFVSREATGFRFVEITKKIMRVLSAYEGKKKVAHVRSGFYKGERWLKLLGFSCVKRSVQSPSYPDGTIIDVFEKGAEA